MRKFDSLFRAVLILLTFFAFSNTAFAQAIIKGVVTNASGQPLPGTTVIVEKDNRGTTTDNRGEYTITTTAGKKLLIFSYVGYNTLEVSVVAQATGTTTFNVKMNANTELSEVTVTGSRAIGRTRIETAVPVDVIPLASVINDLGQVDLNQILNYIAPSFQSSRQTVSDGTDHVDPAQLRGLGTDQVLVLINGKRRHQSALVNVNGTVNRGQVGTDLSAIPPTAIERVEILRDGAAAQYGSDAIAGVINIILKKQTGVLQGGVSYGGYVTQYPKNYAINRLSNKNPGDKTSLTDGNSFQANLGYGFNIGKGSLVITGEYLKRSPTNRTGTYTGPIFPNVNGANRDDSILAARGQNRNNYDIRAGNSAMEGGTVFYNFDMPVGKNGKIYAFGGYGKKNGEAAGFFRYPSGFAGNARVFASNATALYPNGFLPLITSDIIDFSTAVGFKTKFDGWNLDVSNTYGINTFDFGVQNSVNYSQFSVAGNKQTSFDAGGLKNWQNTINADITKKFGVLQGLNLAGGLEYRIDAFGIRSGEEASYLNYNVSSGASAGSQVFPGFLNTIGDIKTRNAFAVYTDAELDISKAWLLTGALRFENYSDFGSTLNYKVSSRYKVTNFLNVRASVSSGFRAPSMQQRFFAKTNTLFLPQGGQLVAVQAGTFTNDSRPAQILGIPTLKQETSTSVSVGVTAKPIPELEITVDAYQIDIDNRIILTNNFTGGSDANLKAQLDAVGASTANFFTNAIDTRASGLEAVVNYTKKFSRQHSLRTTLAMIFIDNKVKNGADGKPLIKASPALLNSGQLGNYFNREDESRVEVANPQNKISLTFNYKYNKWGAMVRFVNFGKVTYLDPSINPANPGAFPINTFTGQRETLDQVFSAKTVTDVSISYEVIPAITTTIGANNLFDVYQDIQNHSSNQSLGRFLYSRRVQQMGFNGAYFFARVNFNFNTKQKK